MKKKLVWQDTSKKVVLKSTIMGHFAMWAVRQSPYLYPRDVHEGIEEFSDALNGVAEDIREHHCIKTTCNGLKEIVCQAISESKTVGSWNVPKKGQPQAFVAVDRYSEPDPDYDIIDLHALARNIAHSIWLELCYDDGDFETPIASSDSRESV